MKIAAYKLCLEKNWKFVEQDSKYLTGNIFKQSLDCIIRGSSA